MVAHLNDDHYTVMNVSQGDEERVADQIINLHPLPTGHPYGDNEHNQWNEQGVKDWRLCARHLSHDEPTGDVGENRAHHPINEPRLSRKDIPRGGYYPSSGQREQRYQRNPGLIGLVEVVAFCLAAPPTRVHVVETHRQSHCER